MKKIYIQNLTDLEYNTLAEILENGLYGFDSETRGEDGEKAMVSNLARDERGDIHFETGDGVYTFVCTKLDYMKAILDEWYKHEEDYLSNNKVNELNLIAEIENYMDQQGTRD